MSPQSFIFIGRSGSGKGTQAALVMEYLKKHDPEHPPMSIETGAELRKFIKEDSYVAGVVRKVYESGGLMESFVPIYIWTDVMKKSYTGKEHLVFDGTPRKPLEAEALDRLFPFFGLDKPWVIYLDVGHDETTKRLIARGRPDDTAENMAKRLAWYETDVAPCIEFYRKDPHVNLLEIDGHGSIEEVHAEIVKRTGLS